MNIKNIRVYLAFNLNDHRFYAFKIIDYREKNLTEN